MKTFTAFCKRYELDQAAPDSLIQYEQYQDAYRTLMSIAGEPPSPLPEVPHGIATKL